MSALPKRLFTAEEYLAIERKAEFKSEFFRGEMFAMAGASPNHNRVKDMIIRELGARLKRGPCHTYSSDQRILVDRTGLYSYPDIVVQCETPEFDTIDDNAITNPSAIIEVLSPSTEKYDRGPKFRNYQQIPSLKEYILVAQDEALVDRFVRQADGSWALVSFVGLDAVMKLATVTAEIPLSEIYSGVEFPPPEL